MKDNRTLNEVAERFGINEAKEEREISPEAEKVYKVLINNAKEGYRIIHKGKTIWGGLGNRAGLHSYADTIIGDKWRKSGPRFEKKLRKLTGDFELHDYRSISRDKGRWVKIKTFKVTA